MGTSIELKKRKLAELKKESDKLKAEIKADDEKHGRHLDLTCLKFTSLPGQVFIKPNVNGELFIAKTEMQRMKRFFDIMAEKYV